jgi:hypothetical protein
MCMHIEKWSNIDRLQEADVTDMEELRVVFTEIKEKVIAYKNQLSKIIRWLKHIYLWFT